MKDPSAALGHSEILSIEDAPRRSCKWSRHHTRVGPFVPATWVEWGVCADQSAQKAAEGVIRGGEDTGDVLPDGPSVLSSVKEVCEGEGEVATVILQRKAFARDAKGLTGGAPDQQVRVRRVKDELGEVPDQGNVGVVMLQDRAREGFDLREHDRRPPQGMPRHRGRFDPGAHTHIAHQSIQLVIGKSSSYRLGFTTTLGVTFFGNRYICASRSWGVTGCFINPTPDTRSRSRHTHMPRAPQTRDR